ncbi:MAG: VTT domain-containing protein [Candidatus Korobacteraceae bacterium]
MTISLLAAATAKKTIWHAVRRFGGPGLIALGLLDNSVIPLPGSMDACTILLAAAHREPWWYYAIMATIGGVVGGYVTYRLGLKGGKESLERKLSKKRADQVYGIFRRYGFWSVAVSAVLPPPAPIVPILIAAGALQYPRNKFLVALGFGRGVRYTLLAYLGFHYGRHILRWLGKYYQPLLYILIALAVVGGLVGLYYWLRYKRRGKDRSRARPVQKPA